jgi:tetratricopeptide (TPR) repeat protein
MEKIFCEECGKEIDNETIFCESCGARVKNDPAADQTQYTDTHAPPVSWDHSETIHPKKIGKLVIAGIAAIIILAAIIMVVLNPGDSGQSSSSYPATTSPTTTPLPPLRSSPETLSKVSPEKTLNTDEKATLDQLKNQGRGYDSKHQYQEAVSTYQRVLEIDPGDESTWHSLGIDLEELGRYEEAIHAIDQALTLDPGYYYAWNTKGYILMNTSRNEEARTCFEKALEIYPAYTAAQKNLDKLNNRKS